MTKCSNCSSEAFFAYLVTPEFSIPYCSKHLPKFLNKLSSALVKLTNVPPTASVSKKKKSEPKIVEEPVIEETVVEEPVIEEIPVEEPTFDEGELEVKEAE